MQTIVRIRLPENGVFLCRAADSASLSPGDTCLAELDYGLDVAEVLELQGVSEGGGERLPSFRVVRRLADEDGKRLRENEALAERARAAFQGAVRHEKGGVRVLYARFSYARERLFIRYAAWQPVDLRRFVGQIQRDYKTHVDLWQVGVRDEAALIGCMGPCGREACCCRWQRQFKSVNVRMAKSQEMSLNPMTINGTCGRLKCCLRFEYEQYREAGEGLPGAGSVITCEESEGAECLVVGRDVLKRRLTVRTRDGRFFSVAAERVTVVRGVRPDEDDKEYRNEDSAGEWSEP
jgi:cell fate regulator YaaT (PSP1 superfamily)